MIEDHESRSLTPYLWIAATVFFTVYGQLVMKWQVGKHSPPDVDPALFHEKLMHLVTLLLKPWIVSAYAAAFLASLAWMMAIKQLAISTAYPFMAMNFVLVMFAGVWFFDEKVSPPQLLGIILVVIGVALIGRN